MAALMSAEVSVGQERHQVDPFWAMIHEISEELTQEDLVTLKTLSRDKIGDELRDDASFTDFCLAFESKYDSEELLKFLKNVWSSEINRRCLDDGQDLLQKLESFERKRLMEKQRMHQYGIEKDDKFVGRKDELEKIGKFLENPTDTITGVCICGMAGMGKTSLASEVCSRTTGSRIIKINRLRGKKTLSDLFISILRGIAMMYPEGEIEGDWSRQSEDVLGSMVHQKLAALGKDTIIIVDNIDDVYTYNSRDLLRVLQSIFEIRNEKACQVKFVLTSREKLVESGEDPGSRTFTPRMGGALLEVELGYLSIKDAKHLLHLYAEKATINNDEALEIVQLCKKCPLVVKMVGTRLNSPSTLTASTMRHRLQTNDPHLGEALQIDHCINEMFESLPEACKKTLIQLSVFETSFDISMVTAVMDTDSVESELNKLKGSHIIEVDNTWEEDFAEQTCSEDFLIDLELPPSFVPKDPSVKYSFHPLILAFLQKKSEPGNSEEYSYVKKEAELRFLQYFVTCIKNNLGRDLDKHSATAFAYIDDQKVHLQNFLRLVSKGDLDFHTRKKKDVKFLQGLCKVRSFVGNRHEQIDFYQKLAQKKEAEGDKMCRFFLNTQEVLLHAMVQNVISNKMLKAQLTTQLPNIEAMSAREEPLKPLALADYYNMLGSITMDSAKYQVEHTMEIPILQEALKYYEKALENYKKWSSQVDIAQVTNSKGCVHFQLHHYEDSLHLHKEAYRILREYIKNDMHTDIPNYLVNIGSVYQSMGNERAMENEVQANKLFNDALQYYAKALEIDRKLGFPNELCEARRLRNKADLHRRLKQFNEAASDAFRAFRMFQKNFQPPHTELTMTLHVMGFVQYSRGKHLRAVANNMLTEEAERAFEKSAEYYGHVRRMIQTGGLLESHHDYQRIRKIHEDVLEALGKFEELNKLRKFYRDFEAGKFQKEICRIQRDMEGKSSGSDSASEHADSEEEDYNAASSEEEMDQEPPPGEMGVAEGNAGGENPVVGNVAADPQPPQQPRPRSAVQRQASVPKKRKMTDDDED